MRVKTFFSKNPGGLGTVLAVAFGLVAVAAAGCGGNTREDGDVLVTPGDSGDGDQRGDDSASGDDARTEDGAPTDGVLDAADTGDTGGDAGPIEPGTFGAPCSGNGDCRSGYCLEAYGARVCSDVCDGACTDGWSCRQDITVFPDVVFVCVPSFPELCRPCDENDVCDSGGTSAGSRCLPRGNDGAFCGGACTAATCPTGYRCEPTADIDGEVTPQCVLEAGAECACSAVAIADQAATTCRNANAFGACAGRRVCLATGLSACDAPEAALDVCNGRDDNCNGQTDEVFVSEPCVIENAIGTCAGETICTGEDGPQCSGTAAERERCGDDIDNDCDGLTDEAGADGCVAYWFDGDGDGVGAGESACLCRGEGDVTAVVGGDCDDTLGTVNPGAPEVCDGRDNDCNGTIDDDGALGCTAWFRDLDGDGFGDPGEAACLCGPDVARGFTVRNGTDCDDTRRDVNPGAAEICDLVDNDCDRAIDEPGSGNCTLHYADADGDGWGDPASFACLCAPDATYPVTRANDCNDLEPLSNPGMTEACDTIDNDCNGRTDEANAEGCTRMHRDSDRDGWGLTSDYRCLCAPLSPWDATRGGDCNDAVADVNPGAPEVCNGQDDNCDTVVDEAGAVGCTTYYRDNDFDSHGVADDSACLCAPSAPMLALTPDDCNDADPFISPSATEVCNSIDDDCNGETDEGVQATCSPFYYDGDGDGWGIGTDSRCLCAPEGLYRAVRTGDCNDADASVHPFAEEFCNSIDDDCDGTTDEERATGCTTRYEDGDEDGYGRFGRTRCLCAPEGTFTASAGGDCNDTEPLVNPGASETCNGVDDDCDGTVDGVDSIGCSVWFRDSDGDSYGLSSDGVCLCGPSSPWSASRGGDCNDADPTMNPGRSETCNGRDDDCSGIIDDPGTEGCTPFFRDGDGDTFGVAGDSQCLCSPNGNYRATNGLDCNDTRTDINPAVVEICNGIDDDCDGGTDEEGATGCTVYLRDFDGDGRGVGGDFRCLCAPGPIYAATVGGDCDDTRDDVYSGAPETCDDVDNDCDGFTDEMGARGCAIWYRDADNDGFGLSADEACLCRATAQYRAQVGGDCNDGSSAISPGADEYCNSVDDDCDGATDEAGALGCRPYFVDGDNDGFGVGESRCLCGPEGLWRAPQGGDCADDDPSRNPGVAEVCDEDRIDDNCNGFADEANAEGCTDHFVDGDGDGFGVTTTRACLCRPTGAWQATAGGDCDDDDDAANPGETEICNGVDDDCDGLFDEGCGMQVGGWPTAKFDERRTGFGKTYAGPLGSTANVPTGSVRAAPAVRWRKRFGTSSILTSPLFDLNGDMIIVAGATVYKVNPQNGDTIWQATLPAAMSGGASPTLRTGGTMVVPSGNGIVLLDADGNRLWYRKFPGLDSEPITGAPLVDDEGRIYTVGYSAAYALDAGGNILWSVAVPNSQYVPSHVAWNRDNDRIYFGCSNHSLFALTRDGQIAWTFVVLDVDVDASTTIGADGSLYQTFGNSFRKIRDAGNRGEQLATVDAGGDMDAHVTIWMDSNGVERVLSNANGNSGLRSHLASNLSRTWTYAMFKDGGTNVTPAIDRNGRVYIGNDNSSSSTWGAFHAVNPDGTRQWIFDLSTVSNPLGRGVKSTVALQEGAVFFGDTAGFVYCLAD